VRRIRIDMDPLLIGLLLAVGAASGFLAGLLGIGGGMLIVPCVAAVLEQLGTAPSLAIKMAIATSMATILFTSLSSVRSHHRRGAVRWDLVRRLTPGITVGSLLAGAGVFAVVRGSVLAGTFGVFVAFAATRMLRERAAAATQPLPDRLGLSVVGAVIGFVSGLVGIGGAFISVPFMTRCGVRIHNAVATSSALGFPIALANTAGYLLAGLALPEAAPAALGYLYLPALATIAPASMLTAPLGARTAHALDVRRLRRAFALLLYVLSAYMIYRGVHG
jgi:uncharacterized protein